MKDNKNNPVIEDAEIIISVELTPQELALIINTIGQLPTQSGTYPLMMKLYEQLPPKPESKDTQATPLKSVK